MHWHSAEKDTTVPLTWRATMPGVPC